MKATPESTDADVAVDQVPEVVEATRARDEGAAALAAAEKTERALRERITPTPREIEVRTPTTVMTVRGLRDAEHVATRVGTPVVDPPAARRARLQLPEVELDVLDRRAALDVLERRLSEVRQTVRTRLVPGSHARVRAAVTEIAKDLAAVAKKVQALGDRLIANENLLLGPDEPGAPEYRLQDFVFVRLFAEERRESASARWIAYEREATWIE